MQPTPPDRDKQLKRRIYCETNYLRFLESLSKDPDTIQPEISRRKACIRKAKEDIAQHTVAILALESKRDNVITLIEQVQARLRSLRQEQNKVLIEKYLKEYLAVNKKLEDYDAGNNSPPK